MPGRLRYVGRYIIEDRTLGKGNFAVVELATHSITKTKVAIKVIDRSKIREDYVRDNLCREARILAQLRHPNVVRLYETISSSSLYCLVTEYAGGGDLLSFVRGQQEGRLPEAVARPFVRQLVSALHHLRERGVVHRDLKMENIMLDEKRKNLKIVDFGLSNIFSPDCLLKTHCGSPEYAAPELFITEQEYGPEVDIWSLGINMFAMVTGRLPFSTPYSENRRQRLMQQIQNGLGVIHEREMAHLTDECQELLSQLIEPSPELRLPLLDIEIHPWITSLGDTPFCPYQQPPKDADIKRLIIDKMACLLNVSATKLETSVHEYRLDEVSAIYNLMMDQYRRSRGFWDADHTPKRKVKRPKPIEVVVRQKTPQEMQEQKEQEEERMELTTPTVIGMVQSSQRRHDGRTCLSADFELSAVSCDRSMKNRAKTATFPQTGVKTRPFGNATTANSVIARYNNFGPPSSARQPKASSSPPASGNNPPMKSKNKEQHGNHQPIGDSVSHYRDDHVAKEQQAHSEGDGPIREVVTSKESTKQPVRKIHVEAGETEDQIAHVKTNAETAHDMKVIDMVKHFTFKHGYIIKETALSNSNSRNDQHLPEHEPEGNRPSAKLCCMHQEKIASGTSFKGDIRSCRSSRASSPTKTAAQSNELLRQQMQLPTRPVNAYFCPHQTNPKLQKTMLLAKRAWHSRYPQHAGRSGRRSTDNSQGLVTQSTPTTNSHQRVSPSRSGSDSPRARLPTSVATLHAMAEDSQHSTPAQAWQGDNAQSGKPKEGTRRNAMPQRPDWKRSTAAKTRGWTEDGEALMRGDVEKGGGIGTMKKLQEMMSKDNVHQMLPNGNIRVKSGKIGTPRSIQSPDRKSQRSSGTSSRKVSSSDMHKSFTSQAYKGPYIMDRYKGQHQRSHTHPLSKNERVVDLNQQHMISLLQEASSKFEDSLKAERRKNQAVRSGDRASWHRGNKSTQTPSSPPSKAKQTQQQQQMIHGEGPVDGESLDEGTVALQLGQRVQLVRGSLAVNSKPPPVLSNDMAPEHVFNLQASREAQVQQRVTKNKQQPLRNMHKKTDNKEVTVLSVKSAIPSSEQDRRLESPQTSC